MQIQPTDYQGAVSVDGYGPGFFRVDGQVLNGPVLVTATGAQPWGGLDDAAPLAALAGSVDVLFIGMGAQIAPAPRDLVQRLETAGVMVEPMTTPAAARTYNVTLSEGRRVACALIPV
ncbi:MAG: Mth938-like domain-containing protein [Paracoccus sp. (in: a-proteobacteria)]|uniref:Mth938-like domain-containing protein n=1 Tax=Paracoccus sp. TaxID=267 RepID=UPI0026E01C91|nr:Mth938-like domain-containing protein [Paracoccus sp. (in: a-proteobacteria)]MDO5611841.1 Mth938-like domain-containing protein [Paracoccus sp. (in: a-proteobacteria)]